jgi:D-arabinose 1-dehydrogenase-like Zn-dependent alcohol dehydrogenase
MRAAVATAVDKPLSITDQELPEPGQGEVLVKITACGVCFTDLGLLQGHYPFARFPVIPGHEITGTVAALGPGVTWPEVGTPVGAQFLYDSCGHCDHCVRGEQILCTRKRITGIVADGGYAEYAVLKAGFVTPLPAGLDPVAGAPLMCAGITAFNGLRQAGAKPGSRVAVIGLGGVGGMAVRYAAAMGARVAVLNRSRRGEDQAKELGAELYIATEDTDPATALKAWDGGANVVLNAAPSTAAAAATLGGLAPDGTLVLCGYGPDPLTLPTQPMVMNRLHVMANPSGSPHDLRDTLAFSVRHGIIPEVTPISLDDAPATLEAMAKGGSSGRSVIVF